MRLALPLVGILSLLLFALAMEVDRGSESASPTKGIEERGVEPQAVEQAPAQPEREAIEFKGGDEPQAVALPAEIAVRDAEIAHLRLNLAKCQHEGTLYGDFLARTVPGEFTTEELTQIHKWLSYFPVQLATAEARWLCERERLGDWSTWGPSNFDAVYRYLGPERIKQEVLPETWADILEWVGITGG